VKWLVTGGAGFIGCNAGRRLMDEGHELVVFDNLSRKGTRGNLEWRREQGPVTFVRGVAVARIETAQGECYNIGGGRHNVLSLLELLSYLEDLIGREIPVTHAGWRPGDQRVFVADVRKAERELGWTPATPKYDGIRALAGWVETNRELFDDV
jgi:nucleoside-diphosphate-sugar epimerase